MRHAFYDSKEYQAKQSDITSRNQRNRVYEHLKKEDARVCVREECDESFVTQPKSPKQYCSNRCAATVNNSKRCWSDEVKQKISKAHAGKKSPFKGLIRIPRKIFICNNPNCKDEFYAERYKKRKFCTVLCAIKFYGSQPTSAKASRGKSGIGPYVDSFLNFHS
ncbi:MAG: NUMOD3 domain-containing DNA-binding protein, partial [Rectinemataceae bacterium]|nr:NUMOD3 domain-containing DNA-binding protein [Rectinemataceae bacterium]